MNTKLLSLPGNLLHEQSLLKTVVLFDHDSNLLAKEGDIADSKLVRLAGHKIAIHQICYEEFGWREDFCQDWQQSSDNQFVVLIKIQEYYLLLLTYACQREELPQLQFILNSLKKRSSQKDNLPKSIKSTIKINSTAKQFLNNVRLLIASIGIVMIPIAGLSLSTLSFPFQLQVSAISIFAILLGISMLLIYFLIRKAVT